MKTNKWLWIVLLGILSICGLTCLTIIGISVVAPALYESMLQNSSVAIGQTAPEFKTPTLDGKTIQLSQFRGQPVILTIGATWCPDCRVQAPLLQEIHEKYPALTILDVNSKESADIVQAYVEEFGLTYTVLLDLDGSIANDYQILAIPTTFFLDADGVIQEKLVERINEQDLNAALRKIGIEK